MAEQAMPRLRQRYQEEIVPALMAKFKYTNINQVPKLEKIVLNMGIRSEWHHSILKNRQWCHRSSRSRCHQMAQRQH